MSHKLPKYPMFVRPSVASNILNFRNQDIVPETQAFIRGDRDIGAPIYRDIADVLAQQTARTGKTLTNNLLALQGYKGQMGGSANKQIAEPLTNLAIADNEALRMLALKIIGLNNANRKWGVNTGQNTVGREQQFAINSANMENNYNRNAWDANVKRKLYRRANANTFRNIGVPIVKAGIGLLGNYLTGGASGLANIFSKIGSSTAGASGLGTIGQPSNSFGYTNSLLY